MALIRYGDYYERYERLYGVATGIVLDPYSAYLRAVQWSNDQSDWDDYETAIVSYAWAAIRDADAEMQAWLAHQTDGERNVRMMHAEVQSILSLLEK